MFKQRWLSQRKIVEERRLNGWEVFFEQRREAAWEPSAHIFGAHRLVTIDAVVDQRVADTDLSRWLARAFYESVHNVCNGNDASLAGAGPSMVD